MGGKEFRNIHKLSIIKYPKWQAWYKTTKTPSNKSLVVRGCGAIRWLSC